MRVEENTGEGIAPEHMDKAFDPFFLRVEGGRMMTRKILVIDYDLAFFKMLREFLEDKGYSVTEVHDGEQALEAYDQERPDVVMLAMVMPRMKSLVTLRKLKALDPGASILMVSDVCEEEPARQAMAEGAFDFITKPFIPDYLELALIAGTALSGSVDRFDSNPVLFAIATGTQA
ncbi:MAG: response regulator [Candidatus Brocadiales bacterium]|nr:response regulator [Candidatus Bathyanammoxibius sp.]